MRKVSDFDLFTQRVRLAAMQRVSEVGIMRAFAEAGVSREAYGRVLGELNVQRGTVLAIGHALGLVNVTPVAISSQPVATDIGS